MAIKGRAQAMKNLDAIDRRAVPPGLCHDTEPSGGGHLLRKNGLFSCQGAWPFPVVLSVPASG